MTAPRSVIPAPRPAAAPSRVPRRDAATGAPDRQPCRAVAYQRVLHQLVRRELRLLAELAAWAPADEAERTADADPARRPARPGAAAPPRGGAATPCGRRCCARSRPDAAAEVRARRRRLDRRCARIDHMLRDVSTAARQWAVAGTAAARDAFAAGLPSTWPTPSTPRPPTRSARCCPSLDAHLRDRRLGRHRPRRRTAGSPAASSCWCSAWRSRTPAPPTAPACSAACRARPAWPGGLSGAPDLPGGRRPAAGRAAGRLSGRGVQ